MMSVFQCLCNQDHAFPHLLRLQLPLAAAMSWSLVSLSSMGPSLTWVQSSCWQHAHALYARRRCQSNKRQESFMGEESSLLGFTNIMWCFLQLTEPLKEVLATVQEAARRVAKTSIECRIEASLTAPPSPHLSAVVIPKSFVSLISWRNRSL